MQWWMQVDLSPEVRGVENEPGNAARDKPLQTLFFTAIMCHLTSPSLLQFRNIALCRNRPADYAGRLKKCHIQSPLSDGDLARAQKICFNQQVWLWRTANIIKTHFPLSGRRHRLRLLAACHGTQAWRVHGHLWNWKRDRHCCWKACSCKRVFLQAAEETVSCYLVISPCKTTTYFPESWLRSWSKSGS